MLRIKQMIARSEDSKNDFRYIDSNQAHKIINTYVKNSEMMNVLLGFIEEKSITGFQLKDILVENFTFEKIKAAIKA